MNANKCQNLITLIALLLLCLRNNKFRCLDKKTELFNFILELMVEYYLFNKKAKSRRAIKNKVEVKIIKPSMGKVCILNLQL